MKKISAVLLAVLSALALCTPAFADIAPAPYYRVAREVPSWGIAFLIAIVIVAAAIIVLAIRDRKK